MSPLSYHWISTSPRGRISYLLSCWPIGLVNCIACPFMFGICMVEGSALSLSFRTLQPRPRILPCLTLGLTSLRFSHRMILWLVIRMSCPSRLFAITWPIQSSFVLMFLLSLSLQARGKTSVLKHHSFLAPGSSSTAPTPPPLMKIAVVFRSGCTKSGMSPHHCFLSGTVQPIRY